MTKNEYLNALSKSLSALKSDERAKSLAYYSELIDDKIEGGLTEEQAVAELEAPEAAAERIIQDASERNALKKRVNPLNTTLLIIGSPVWLALAIAAFAVVFSLYVSAWAVVISFFAADLAFAVSFVASILLFAFTVGASPVTAAATVGMGLFCAGASVMLFMGLVSLSRMFVSATKKGVTEVTRRINERKHSI